MKKLLFISNVSKRITNFAIPSIIAGQALGYEVHLAANYSEFDKSSNKYNVTIHHIDIQRNPFGLTNIRAFFQMMFLLKKEGFDVIHCNTPVGGLLGRLCGKIAKVPTIIYTAHGFHFYKGASLFNRTVIKWVEMWLARYTDALLVMNKEDYEAAKKFKLKNDGKAYFIPGVGVNTNDYNVDEIDNTAIRASLGLCENDVVLIAMGDLIHRKNYPASIRAIAKLDNKNIHLLICGKGPKLNELQSLAAELGVENQIHFLGFRTDIKELLAISDIFLFTTYQEGLSRSMMEAMSAGLPCIASKIRGNMDLIEESKGGYLYHPDDVEGFANGIRKIAEDKELRLQMGEYNLHVIKKYDVNNVKSQMKAIYNAVLEN